MTVSVDAIKQILKSVETGQFDFDRARDADCLPEAVAHALYVLVRDRCSNNSLSLFCLLCKNYRKHHCYSSNAKTALETQILLQKIMQNVTPCRDVVLLTRGAYKHACNYAKSTTALLKTSYMASDRCKTLVRIVKKSTERARLSEVLRKTDFGFCELRNASEDTVCRELTTLFDNICVLRNCLCDKRDQDDDMEMTDTGETRAQDDSDANEILTRQEWNDLLVETCALLLTLWHARGKHHILRSLVWLALETSAMHADASLSEFGKLPRHGRWLNIVRVVQDAESLVDYGKDLFLVYTLHLLTRGNDADICLAIETSRVHRKSSSQSSSEHSEDGGGGGGGTDDNSIADATFTETHDDRTSDWLKDRFDALPDPDWSRSMLSATIVTFDKACRDDQRPLSQRKRGKKRKIGSRDEEDKEGKKDGDCGAGVKGEQDDESGDDEGSEYEMVDEDAESAKSRGSGKSNARISLEVASRRKKYSGLPAQGQETEYASQWFERCGILETNNRGVEQTFVCALRDTAAEKFGHRSAIVFGPFEKRWQSTNIVFCHQLRQAIQLPDILPVAETCLETTLRADIYNRGTLDFDIALNYVLLSVGADLRPPLLALQLVKTPPRLLEDENDQTEQQEGAPDLVTPSEESGREESVRGPSWLSSAGLRSTNAGVQKVDEDAKQDRADWSCKCALNGVSVFTRHQMATQADKKSTVSVFVTLAWRFMLGMNRNTSQRTLVRAGKQFDGRAVLDHWDIFNDNNSADKKLFQRKQSDLVASQMDQFLQDRSTRNSLLSALILLRSRFNSDQVVALFENFTASASLRINLKAHESANARLQMLIDRLEVPEREHFSMGGNAQTDLQERPDSRHFWRSFF